MAMSAAQRRKVDRERKREQREAAATQGRPPRVETVNAAIVEAVAFATLAADQRIWSTADNWVPVNLSVIITVATDILAHRYQFDRPLAKDAVIARMRPRGRHRMSTNVPSINPDFGLPRYRTAAPEMAACPH